MVQWHTRCQVGLKTSPPNHIWGLCVDAALWSCATRSWPRHIAGVHRNVESRIELWGLFIQPLFNEILCVFVCVYACSVVFNSLWPHGLQPTRLLCPWDFPVQEYWSGLPFSSPGSLPDPGIEPVSPALANRFFTTEPPGKPQWDSTQVIRAVESSQEREREASRKTGSPQAKLYPNHLLSVLPCRKRAQRLREDTALALFLEKLETSGQRAMSWRDSLKCGEHSFVRNPWSPFCHWTLLTS